MHGAKETFEKVKSDSFPICVKVEMDRIQDCTVAIG